MSRPSARGSATLVALLAAILLGLFGLALLTMAEQETRISLAQRDGAQAQLLAESALTIARTWFDDPDPENPFRPGDDELCLSLRRGHEFADDYGNARELGSPANSPRV